MLIHFPICQVPEKENKNKELVKMTLKLQTYKLHRIVPRFVLFNASVMMWLAISSPIPATCADLTWPTGFRLILISLTTVVFNLDNATPICALKKLLGCHQFQNFTFIYLQFEKHFSFHIQWECKWQTSSMILIPW